MPSQRVGVYPRFMIAVVVSAYWSAGMAVIADDLPKFEKTVAEVEATAIKTIKTADELVAKIIAVDQTKLSFATLYVALDDVENTISQAKNRFDFLSVAHPDGDVQEAASGGLDQVKQWRTKLFTNDEVYGQIQKYQESSDPRIKAEREGLNEMDQRLMSRLERDFRRNGFHLPRTARDEVTQLFKDLADLMSKHGEAFDRESWVVFTRDELSGVPADLRARFTRLEGMYKVRATSLETSTIYRNSPIEATRKKAMSARYSRAFTENAERSYDILRVRAKLAKLLGYQNWAEYQTEITMMKNPAAAQIFLSEVNEGLDPLFRDDLALLNRLKAKELNDLGARIQSWDVDYFVGQRLKNDFNVDATLLRQFFEYDHTMKGLFAVLERVFGLKFEEQPLTDKWHDDVTGIRVKDAASDRLLGIVYFDMFPRENKIDSFSSWTIRSAKCSENSSQTPAAVVLGNVPKTDGSPSLLDLREVQVLFHEMGHALHEVLGHTPYATLSGIKVETDFAEAPAAMLESFITDKGVLKLIAKHHSDPSKRFPEEMVDRLEQSRAFSERISGKRVIALAQMDMDIHTSSEVTTNRFNLTAFTDRIMADIFLAPPEATSFINTFQHLFVFGEGYDGGYYQYTWASALAADLASRFEEANDGYLDAAVGKSYRQEVLEKGGSRDAKVSIEKFLGRPFDQQAYLKRLGVITQ
jgi:Zn-dependent oligopeptidase